MVERIVYRGWASICQAMDLSKRSADTAKKILNEAGILEYEQGRPIVLKSKLEQFYFIRFHKRG